VVDVVTEREAEEEHPTIVVLEKIQHAAGTDKGLDINRTSME